jgi:hypothetical protein
VPIEFCDLLSDEGWAPLTVDPHDPHHCWERGGSLAGAPVDVAATLTGRLWRSTKVDPTFNAFGVRYAARFSVPRRHHNLRQLVIVFGGTVTVEWGLEGEDGRESFGLGEFWVTDAGTPYSLTTGPEAVTVVESWSKPVDQLTTYWHDHRWVKALTAEIE